MKRRRPCPNIFSVSDSDDQDSPSNNSRLKSKVSSSPNDPVDSTSTIENPSLIQPDSLDTFMNALPSSSSFPSISRPMKSDPQPSSKFSNDESLPVSNSAISSRSNSPTANEVSQTGHDKDNQPQTLTPVDFSSQPLPPFSRLEFLPPSHLEMDSSETKGSIIALRATVRNGSAPILSSFQDICPPISKKLSDVLCEAFLAPSPIQAISLPYTLSGRDIVAIAQTGSGKTIAYALPLLTHVSAQKGSSRSGHGPVGLVMVPTRDLATQIADVLNQYGRCLSVSTCCVVGGVPKYEQFKQIRDSGAGIVVCTPGRYIDMLRMRACHMKRCSFVVLDEADRMLDMGFEPQVRTLLSQIRPDAQRALFSATMPRFVERLSCDVLSNPVFISLSGSSHQHTAMVNENVNDCFFHFSNESARTEWLIDHLSTFVSEGLLIIFCSTRGDSAALANIIRGKGMPAACIHGETDQSDREGLLRMFRGNELPVLVTTDVAARGLDIENVQNVVNYGCAKSWEWHVHRVGRSGRANQKGSAYTLMDSTSQSDMQFAEEAAAILRREKRTVPTALLHLQKLSRSLPRKDNQRRRKFRRH